MIFARRAQTLKEIFLKKYNSKILFILVCLENTFIGCVVTSQSCLRIRINSSKTINQYPQNLADNFKLSDQRLMLCVETLRVTPKLCK